MSKHERFICDRPIKRYGEVHEIGSPIEVEAEATAEIEHLLEIKAMHRPGKDDEQKVPAGVDIDDLALAIQRMTEKDPDKEKAEWWVKSSGEPELAALAAEAGVDKVTSKERTAALAKLAG